jgi:1-acyl-sn-glycerol-3-phosphate acyltransferase
MIYLILFLIFAFPVHLILCAIGRKHPETKDRAAKAIVSWAFSCVRAISGTKVIVRGQENIPTDTAVLYVGNHRSYFDIILTLGLFPRVTGYVAKAEMKKVPLLRLWMKNIHCLFLDRNNIKEGLKTILAGVEEVKNGISLCIFPEGTRNKTSDTFLPFHDGSFKIAEKGKVPVIPMTIVNSADVFEDHFPRIKKTTVVVVFDKPVYIDQLDKEERKSLGTYVGGIISDRYFAVKKEFSL